MHSKRGQEMSTSTIILIVLGLIVLVILAIGFMMGWENVAPWLASKSNVEDVRRQCSLACSKESKYDYCSKLVELKDEKKNEIQGATCNLLSGVPTFKTKWGIETCSKIDCEKFECEEVEGVIPIKENILKGLIINELTITQTAKLTDHGRKYLEKGIIKQHLRNQWIKILYKLRVSPERLARISEK